jgi:hypothetical protein
MNSINDWSEYLIWAEKNMKELEYGLLHKKYDSANKNVVAIVDSLVKVLLWIEEHREQ